MSQTYIYITDLLLFMFLAISGISAQPGTNRETPDSVDIPLKIRMGFDITGPVIWYADKKILNTEGYISADLNEKMAVSIGGGYSDYSYSQYNYAYLSNGTFFKAGIDLNMLQPELSTGRYWAGVGIRYGLSLFSSETSLFTHENYWGKINSSIGSAKSWGHYVELSPGFKAELFKNFSIGWSISLRKLLYPGLNKDLNPLYIPGYGSGKTVSAGVSYFLSWNIPFKRIRVEIKQEEPEEPLDEDETENQGINTNSQSLGGNRPATRFR